MTVIIKKRTQKRKSRRSLTVSKKAKTKQNEEVSWNFVVH